MTRVISWALGFVIFGTLTGVVTWLWANRNVYSVYYYSVHDVATPLRIRTAGEPNEVPDVKHAETLEGTDRGRVLSDNVLYSPTTGTWVIAKRPGKPSPEGVVRRHAVPACVTIPLEWLFSTTLAVTLPAPVAEAWGFFDGHRVVAIVTGAFVLLLGYVGARAAAAIVMGILGAAAAVLGGIVLDLEHPWFASESTFTLLAGVGFMLGVAYGVLPGTFPAYVAQRLGSIVLLLVVSPVLADIFGWPLPITWAVVVLGDLFSPVVGGVLLGGALISIGLGAPPLFGNAVLTVALAITHRLIKGRWIPAALIRRRDDPNPRTASS